VRRRTFEAYAPNDMGWPAPNLQGYSIKNIPFKGQGLLFFIFMVNGKNNMSFTSSLDTIERIRSCSCWNQGPWHDRPQYSTVARRIWYKQPVHRNTHWRVNSQLSPRHPKSESCPTNLASSERTGRNPKTVKFFSISHVGICRYCLPARCSEDRNWRGNLLWVGRALCT